MTELCTHCNEELLEAPLDTVFCMQCDTPHGLINHPEVTARYERFFDENIALAWT